MSPVSVSKFQSYLKDASTGTDFLAFLELILDISTEYVYTWLDRDFTASATKTDTFMGNGTNWRRLPSAAESIDSWQSEDPAGTVTSLSTSEILLFESGLKVVLKTKTFDCENEYTITYTQPSTLACPESVAQVILEHAAIMFQESNQGAGILGEATTSMRDAAFAERLKFLDLSERHKEILRMYKRYPV